MIESRKLSERSYLKFIFPGVKPVIVELPFFENPVITENKKAKLAAYDLVSKNTSLFGFLGAKARELNVKFNITLPHIMDKGENITLDKFICSPSIESKENEKKKFKSFVDVKDLNSLKEQQAFNARRRFDELLNSPFVDKEISQSLYAPTPSDFTNSFFDFILPSSKKNMLNGRTVKDFYIEIMLWWVNIIRCSVMNNSLNPVYGPPIIRISHGLLYNSVACLCNGYNISVDEMAGYDLETLMPNRVIISLNLFEVRDTISDKYEPNITGDASTGWEAILTYGTMDPYSDMSEGGW